MRSRQHPSARQFVIHLERSRRASLEERLAGLGVIATTRLDSDTVVFELRPPTEAEPREAWSMLREVLGEDVSVYPVFLDEEQQPSFPTGSIVVRFREPPRDDDLARFATKHELSLRARDKYAPTQATFETIRHDRFLPDLLDALCDESGVVMAWADTRLQLRHG